MNVAIIGSFVSTNVGGAELSTSELVKSHFPQANIIYIRPLLTNKYLKSFISDDSESSYNIVVHRFPKIVTRILEVFSFSAFSYPCIVYLYFLFSCQSRLCDLFKQCDYVYGVGVNSIPFLLLCRCQTRFIFRSEVDIGLTPIYGRNLLYIKRIIKSFVDWPYSFFYRLLLIRLGGGNQHTFGANSNFTARLASNTIHLPLNQILVFYPLSSTAINRVTTTKNVVNFLSKNKVQVILVVDTEVKGLPIFLTLAKSLINNHKYEFVLISRESPSHRSSYLSKLIYLKWGSYPSCLVYNPLILIPHFGKKLLQWQ